MQDMHRLSIRHGRARCKLKTRSKVWMSKGTAATSAPAGTRQRKRALADTVTCGRDGVQRHVQVPRGVLRAPGRPRAGRGVGCTARAGREAADLALVGAPELRHRRGQHHVAGQLRSAGLEQGDHGEVDGFVDVVADRVHKVLRDRCVAQGVRMRACRRLCLVQPAAGTPVVTGGSAVVTGSTAPVSGRSRGEHREMAAVPWRACSLGHCAGAQVSLQPTHGCCHACLSRRDRRCCGLSRSNRKSSRRARRGCGLQWSPPARVAGSLADIPCPTQAGFQGLFSGVNP